MKANKTLSTSIAAAAAVGSLVLAGAGAAQADPGNGKGSDHGHKKTTSSAVTLKGVQIKGHSPINVFSSATVRPLEVRAQVSDKKAAGVQKVSVTVSLDQYTAKHGTPTATPALTWTLDPAGVAVKSVALTTVTLKHNEARYVGTYTFPVQAVAPGATATVCLASVDAAPLPGQTVTVKVAKKATKKVNGGDCVRIINQDPSK